MEKKFICGIPSCVVGPPVLAAQLVEFARPVRHEERSTGIVKRRLVGVVRPVVAGAAEPPSGELILSGQVITERVLLSAWLLAPTPDQLRSADERAVNGSLERTPPQRGVDAIELGRELPQVHPSEHTRRIVATRVRGAEIDIGVLREV